MGQTSQRIIVDRNGERFGPYTFDEARACLAEGRFVHSDKATIQGTEKWLSVATILGVTAPPPPQPKAAPSQLISPSIENSKQPSVATVSKAVREANVFGLRIRNPFAVIAIFAIPVLLVLLMVLTVFCINRLQRSFQLFHGEVMGTLAYLPYEIKKNAAIEHGKSEEEAIKLAEWWNPNPKRGNPDATPTPDGSPASKDDEAESSVPSDVQTQGPSIADLPSANGEYYIVGTVLSVTDDGILVTEDYWVNGVRTTSTPFLVRGRFNYVDGDRVEMYAAPAGTYKYTSTLGSVKTVHAFRAVPRHRAAPRRPPIDVSNLPGFNRSTYGVDRPRGATPTPAQPSTEQTPLMGTVMAPDENAAEQDNGVSTNQPELDPLLNEWLAASNSGDPQREAALYWDPVDYQNKGPRSHNQMVKDLTADRQRWPSQRFEFKRLLQAEQMGPSAWHVEFRVTFAVGTATNPNVKTGETDISWIVRRARSGALKIVSLKQELVK